MKPRRTTPDDSTIRWRIGEVAKLTGVTPRTLRYWEELDLLQPADHTAGQDRLYSSTDISRVNRIRNLQELLGFSLAEVRAILVGPEDIAVLDRVHSELDNNDVTPLRRRELIEEAIKANDQLLTRLDDTLARIKAFRDERAAVSTRLHDELQQFDQ